MKEKIKNNLATIVIFAAGIMARIGAFIFARLSTYQHDALAESGHMDYALWIFRNLRLADNNYYEFAQPPLNAIMQALLMKVLSPLVNLASKKEIVVGDYTFNNAEFTLYSYTKILTLVYSIIILVLLYKIIKEFDLPKIAKNVFFGMMALYPGFIVMTTQYSNDCLSYMFFFLSLYLGIKWCKNKDLKTIILLAISIGLGMLTKISVGLIAFILGPMMLIIWIRSLNGARIARPYESRACAARPYESGARVARPYVGASLASAKEGNLTHPSITVQLIIFALIVFPLGLSYSIRNYIMFGQKFGEISDVVLGSVFDMRQRGYNFFERYLSFQWYKLYDGRYDIFHDWTEYNIWVDLLKTSAFDEFQFRDLGFYPIFFITYILNTVFWLVGMISIIYNIIITFVKKITIPENLRNLKNMSLMLFFLAVIAFLSFNITHPYSCNSNWRYVAYITFGLAGSIITFAMTVKQFVGARVACPYEEGARVARPYESGVREARKSVGVSLVSDVGASRMSGVGVSYASGVGVNYASDVGASYASPKLFIILFLLVAFNLLLFSSVSPLHSIMNMQYNEWLYYIIGKGIKYGKVPYVDLIDHKGIYTFFIFAIANIIGETNHIGLYIVSLVFYYVIALFSCNIASLILTYTMDIDERIKSAISIIVGFIVYCIASSYYISFGTITCEVIILAFMLIAYYMFLKYLFTGVNMHSTKNAMIYGILAGIAFFVKANGVLLFVPIAIVLLVTLIKGELYKNLLLNILFGILGFIIALLPGVIYCLVNNCFSEMIEGSFIINMLYTGTGLPSVGSTSLSLLEALDEFKEFIVICVLSIPMFYYLIADGSREARKSVGVSLASTVGDNSTSGVGASYASPACRLTGFYILSLIINIYSVLMSARPYTNYLGYILFYLIIFILFFTVALIKIIGVREAHSNGVGASSINNLGASQISDVRASYTSPIKILAVSIVIFLFVNTLSYSLTLELSNLNGFAQSRLATQVKKMCDAEGIKKKPKLLVVGYAPYLYEEFGVLPDEKYFATPVVSRKKFSKPYDALVKRIESNTEDVIVVSFERSMAKDEEFKSMIYEALDKNYTKIGDAKAVSIKAEVYKKN